MATLKSIKNLYVKDSDAYSLGVGDNANNIALLAFKIAEQDALAIYKMQDGFVDEYEDETGIDTGNSLGQTASTQPTDARIVIFEEDIDAITINTDLKAYASRDNGTTYTEFVLTDEGDYATSKQIWAGSVDISAQPAGTTMRYKIRGFNNSGDAKEFKLHGTCLTWGN